ncbi:hypothetical protein [Virgibacillus ihumii]|uniref:hypothetical protein n=1 Tax=Virgibacillus ihumii TaxID=2686091 RepID=UPI00157E2492|nr:hypothetical protein [Virgibacillus ihumii]
MNEKEIFVGNQNVYVIHDLELDVEFDYISQEEHTAAILELEEHIHEQRLQPTVPDNGYINAHEDAIIYHTESGTIHYASSLESNPAKDQRTEHILHQFYKDCLSFWNQEKERSSGFARAKSPERLAVQDVSFLKHDPTVPIGDLLDENTKLAWLKDKNEELDVLEKPTVILDKQTGGYSIYTNMEDLFEACKQNTLNHLAGLEDEYAYQLGEFEAFTLKDKEVFITDKYEYALLEPTQENIKEWETFHYTKWKHGVSNHETEKSSEPGMEM